MKNFYTKEQKIRNRYTDYSSPTGLDHGMDFMQQNLHWLLHQADNARELYGKDSIEYDSLVARVSNQIAAYGRGGNFTMEELRHYDSAHTATMAYASDMLKQRTGVPLKDHLLGCDWVNVQVKIGNASGNPMDDVTMSRMPSAGLMLPRTSVQKIESPTMYRTQNYKGTGLEIYTRRMTSSNKK